MRALPRLSLHERRPHRRLRDTRLRTRSCAWARKVPPAAGVARVMTTPAEAQDVRELRLVVTAPDYDEALHFYRDVLGLRERAAFIDEVEVGQRVAGHVRVAFEVSDSRATASKLEAAGATVIAQPTVTPWN